MRDLIPVLDRREGSAKRFRTADPLEMRNLLREKVAEECGELLEATTDEIPGEVADVIETVLAYAEACGYSEIWCDAVRRLKLDEHGGFGRRQVMRTD